MTAEEKLQVEQLQDAILQIAAKWKPPLTAATQAAFRAMPRHAFVKSYLSGDKMVNLTPENLPNQLPAIYKDGPLNLWKVHAKGQHSTISQPTLVLKMLDLLSLAEGHRVFEVGAGSGWNAAMMSYMVGTSGRVYSAEIIPEMAERARQVIADRGISNLEIVTGDAGDGYAEGAPFDRAVFTAGSYDLPRAFHEQVRVGGLLLMVVKVEGGGDQLILLEKTPDFFESKSGSICGFVPMTGKHAFAAGNPGLLDALPDWSELARREVNRRPFWWGGSEESSSWAAIGVRSFLSIVEPRFRVFRDEASNGQDPRNWFCGLFDPETRSIAIARKGELVSYGNVTARDQLVARLHEWIDLGMPSVTAMRLRIFPTDAKVLVEEGEWLVKRNESSFVWSLKRPF